MEITNLDAPSRRLLDTGGVVGATVCVIHCGITLIALGLPALQLVAWFEGSELWFHIVTVAFVTTIATLRAVPLLRERRYALGLALLIAVALAVIALGFEASGEESHISTVMMLFGSFGAMAVHSYLLLKARTVV